MIGCHFILIGKENIVKDSGAVVLINHQSCLDVIGNYINTLKKKKLE